MSETAPHCLYGHHHSIDFSCCFHRENNKELKAGKRLTEKALEALSKEALRQIDEKNYETEQRAHGAEHILKIGIAFSDKNVKVTTNHSF